MPRQRNIPVSPCKKRNNLASQFKRGRPTRLPLQGGRYWTTYANTSAESTIGKKWTLPQRRIPRAAFTPKPTLDSRLDLEDISVPTMPVQVYKNSATLKRPYSTIILHRNPKFEPDGNSVLELSVHEQKEMSKNFSDTFMRGIDEDNDDSPSTSTTVSDIVPSVQTVTKSTMKNQKKQLDNPTYSLKTHSPLNETKVLEEAGQKWIQKFEYTHKVSPLSSSTTLDELDMDCSSSSLTII